MKKLLIIITILAAFGMIAAVKPVTTLQYWYKARQYFTLNPIIKNSGGTDTDTLSTMAYARSFGGVSGDFVASSTFDSLVADTITLPTALLQYVATLATYEDNAAALSALGAGKLYFLETGVLARTFTP